MTNKRDLKAYVRYDGSGRVIAGSLVLRRKKPAVGNWHQIQGYECCNQEQVPIVVEIESEFPFNDPDLVLDANGGANQYLFNYTSGTVADVDALAAHFNSTLHHLGSFKVMDGDLIFTPNETIASLFVASGATSISGYAFAD